jgi:hypothetical protein
MLKMREFVKSLPLLILLIAVSPGCEAQAGAVKGTRNFVSPDGEFSAVVIPSGKKDGSDESRVEIRNKNGRVICVHDFSSEDGEHGYGVDEAQWTPDRQFFVFRMRNSGGHSPMFAPIMFWSRSANRFYELIDYTADQSFSITAPDKVSVDTWPNLKPATVSLHELGKSQLTELR